MKQTGKQEQNKLLGSDETSAFNQIFDVNSIKQTRCLVIESKNKPISDNILQSIKKHFEKLATIYKKKDKSVCKLMLICKFNKIMTYKKMKQNGNMYNNC